MSHLVDDPAFWNERYDLKEDGWDLGRAAPPLERLLREAPLPKGRAAVPGCGRGHDVALLASLGWDAVGFDFSDRAVAEAARLGHRVLKRDVFTLGREYPAAFDLLFEYTCLCAIDPARRTEYAEVLASVLRPGGELVALLYPLKDPPRSPPFRIDPDAILRILEPAFEIVSTETPADSIERRRGFELLVRARRR